MTATSDSMSDLSTGLTIVGLSGSLRRDSVNTALLRAADGASSASVVVHDYADVPLFNSDVERPASVDALIAAIEGADGVILAVPEYNYSMSGVLKNAIDWASRPAYTSVFRDKPVGVVSASPSFTGGARGQQHAKSVLLGMGAAVFPWPEFLVPGAFQKFTDGVLTDEVTEGHLKAYMAGFADWVRRNS